MHRQLSIWARNVAEKEPKKRDVLTPNRLKRVQVDTLTTFCAFCQGGETNTSHCHFFIPWINEMWKLYRQNQLTHMWRNSNIVCQSAISRLNCCPKRMKRNDDHRDKINNFLYVLCHIFIIIVVLPCYCFHF